MYKQEHKAGILHFFLCIAAGILVWVLCDIIGLLLKNVFVSDLIFIAAACVLVYCIYAHYCASFSYVLDKKKLIAVRKIGHREYKEEIPLSKINAIYDKKPTAGLPKEVKSFTVNIIAKKKRCYLIYDKSSKCLIFEPDTELLKLLKENING